MLKIFLVLVFLQALIKSTNSTAAGRFPKSAPQTILDAVGGENEFDAEVSFAVSNASAWRNGIPASYVTLKAGGGGVVTKICFDDGVCWSDKMLEPDDQRGLYGMMAKLAVENYCPYIPAPRLKGGCRRKLDHYFTEWVEGKTLAKWVIDHDPNSTIVRIPEKVITSLAEFVYNLTTCPIPKKEMQVMELVPVRGHSVLTNLNTTAWVNQYFYWQHLLSLPTTSEKPFDGLDKMLLLSWVHKQFSEARNQSFVLNYWDLRLPNIIIDKNDNLAGIIDWDDVGAVPLKLSAISIAESFFPEGFKTHGYQLDSTLDEQFQQELRRMEKEKLSSTEWSQMFLHSRENMFLFDILRRGYSFLKLREIYPDLLTQALRRNSENIALAASEWSKFVSETYLEKNITIPDDPDYVEIQEALGICGRSKWKRWYRQLRRNALKRWNMFTDTYRKNRRKRLET